MAPLPPTRLLPTARHAAPPRTRLQTGLTPTSVELLSVEHMRRRRASPLRAVLRAAAALRHPSTWRLPGTAAEQPAAAGIADDARTEVSELAAALAADADAAAQDGSMPALLQLAQPRGAGSEEPPVPLTEALVAQKTAAALAASARQLPAGLWVEAAEEEERRTASGRKLRQVGGAQRSFCCPVHHGVSRRSSPS